MTLNTANFRRPLTVACLILLWLGCERQPVPVEEARTLVENMRVSSEFPPGGLTVNLELQPTRDYVIELRGRLDRGIPTLRVDQGDTVVAASRYLAIPRNGLAFRVRSSGRLRLMIYQDEPFSYMIDSLRLRTSESPDFEIADIFETNLSSGRYALPLPR